MHRDIGISEIPISHKRVLIFGFTRMVFSWSRLFYFGKCMITIWVERWPDSWQPGSMFFCIRILGFFVPLFYIFVQTNYFLWGRRNPDPGPGRSIYASHVLVFSHIPSWPAPFVSRKTGFLKFGDCSADFDRIIRMAPESRRWQHISPNFYRNFNQSPLAWRGGHLKIPIRCVVSFVISVLRWGIRTDG